MEMSGAPKQKLRVEVKTKQQRAQDRQALGSLRSLTVSSKTRHRYDQSLTTFKSFLNYNNVRLPTKTHLMDPLLCEYLEHLWSSGEGRAEACNIVAAIQDAQPSLRGELRASWRLLKVWSANELPNRAPPLPESLLYAMVGYSIFHNHHPFALSLLIGFFGMLRTGELLGIFSHHIFMDGPLKPAVISLGLTKGGRRQGALESVTIGVREVLRRLWQWKMASSSSRPLVPSHRKWREQFATVLSALKVDHLNFRPYSLRRGRATFWFSKHSSLDKLLVQGRWRLAKTARIFVNEGLAILADLVLPDPHAQPFLRIYRKAALQSLPPLEPPRSGKRRGTWKREKS